MSRYSGPGPLYKHLIALKNQTHVAILDYVAGENIDERIKRLAQLVFELERANCTPNEILEKQLRDSIAMKNDKHLGGVEKA